MATLGLVEFQIAKGSYAGFAREDKANVLPLLGRDPALPENNEAIQANAIGSRHAMLDAVVLTSAARDDLEAMLYTQALFDDGSGEVHAVTVMEARVRIPIFTGRTPEAWIVSLDLREYESGSS